MDSLDTTGGRITQFFLLLINLAACVLFVISTYAGQKFMNFVSTVDLIFAVVFSVEYGLRLWIAEDKIKYIFSFYGLVDLISIVPSFLPVTNMSYLRLLKCIRILRFLRYLEDENFFFGKVSLIQLQLFRIIFTVITIIFIFAGTIYYAEHLSKSSSIQTYGDAVYFTVITLSTVGYGDITPSTEASRWFTVLMILSGMFFVPWQVGKLVRVFVNMERGKNQITCQSCGLVGHDEDASHCKSCGNIIFQEYDGT